MTKIVELCHGEDCCPRVEIDAEEIRVGEEGNLVRLTPDQWESLRSKILGGQL